MRWRYAQRGREGKIHLLDELCEVYGVSPQYVTTPEANGKVERLHHYWQSRLHALVGAESIVEIDPANALLEQLRAHHNSGEKHRELDMTPQQAGNEPSAANAVFCGPASAARDGTTSGAHAPASVWAMTVACPSPGSVTKSARNHGYGSCIVCTPTARSASWRISPTKSSAPNCFHISVRSASEKMSRFKCYKIVPL